MPNLIQQTAHVVACSLRYAGHQCRRWGRPRYYKHGAASYVACSRVHEQTSSSQSQTFPLLCWQAVGTTRDSEKILSLSHDSGAHTLQLNRELTYDTLSGQVQTWYFVYKVACFVHVLPQQTACRGMLGDGTRSRCH